MKPHISKLNIVWAAITLIALVIGGFAGWQIISHHPVTAAETASDVALFSFDASKAPGWFAGANIHGGDAIDQSTQAAPLGNAARIIAQGTADHPTGDCFVHYTYWANSTQDLDEALAHATSPLPGSADTLKPVTTTTFTMQTPAGNIRSHLHLYELTGPDTEQLSTGQENAFLKAGTGYIEIAGYCKTAAELPTSFPVLTAVTFQT